MGFPGPLTQLHRRFILIKFNLKGCIDFQVSLSQENRKFRVLFGNLLGFEI